MNWSPRYDASAVRTLEAAVGRPATVHSWAITDTRSGRVKGIYAREELALEALIRLGPGLFVMTIVHPDGCRCPEMVA